MKDIFTDMQAKNIEKISTRGLTVLTTGGIVIVLIEQNQAITL